jgi:hypothetical protein
MQYNKSQTHESLEDSTEAKCLLDRVPVVSCPITTSDFLFANGNASLLDVQLGVIGRLIERECNFRVVRLWPSTEAPLLNNLFVGYLISSHRSLVSRYIFAIE